MGEAVVQVQLQASILVLVAILQLLVTSSALNITKILSDYPEYATFNNLLNQTKIASQIAQRQTITVLALDNDAVSSIATRPTDKIRNILMNHVVLDYFDVEKIRTLGKSSAILTTLYQTTGVAQNQEGFINLTRIAPGNVVFGSAEQGAPLVSKLLGPVFSQPFNLSVLHLSTPIVAPGFGNPVLAPPPPPGSPPPAPAPKKGASAPVRRWKLIMMMMTPPQTAHPPLLPRRMLLPRGNCPQHQKMLMMTPMHPLFPLLLQSLQASPLHCSWASSLA